MEYKEFISTDGRKINEYQKKELQELCVYMWKCIQAHQKSYSDLLKSFKVKQKGIEDITYTKGGRYYTRVPLDTDVTEIIEG